MKDKHINILFPQWQGGGANKATWFGAMEVKKNYLDMNRFFEIEVGLDENEAVENNIWGYRTIARQLKQVRALIDNEKPDTVFTVGGGDDIEVIPMSYANHKTGGDMSVVFFDAHGDLNTPESSPSKNFHGMPLRTLFGESDPDILKLLYKTLSHDQVVMVGTRDCDEAEEEYIAQNNIRVITAGEANADSCAVIDALKEKGSKNVYVHIDIDVLDPKEFPYQPVPADNGLAIETLSGLLARIQKEFNVVGVCILGYTAMDNKRIGILDEIFALGMKDS